MKREARTKKSRLEFEYNKFFSPPARLRTSLDESLEQPSPLRIVPSVSTSGAYEEPIKLDSEKTISQHA